MLLGKSQRDKNPVKVASVAAFSPEGLLLFGLRGDSNKYCMPGGHFEPDEDPLTAAKRELKEETGLIGTNFELLGVGSVKDGKIHVYSFRCVVDGEPDASKDPDEEMIEFEWVEPHDIPKDIVSNLHNKQDVSLNFLGLQDHEITEVSPDLEAITKRVFEVHGAVLSKLVDDPEYLQKGLKSAVAGMALAASPTLAQDKPQEPTPIHQLALQHGFKAWTNEGLHPDLDPIAHLESSYGLNQNHAPDPKGEYHTAFGPLGMKNVTAHEEYAKSKFLKEKYPGLNTPEAFMKTFKADPKFYNLLASAHFARMKAIHGSAEKASYAWRHGAGAAAKATPEQVAAEPYVQRYKALASAPKPMHKSEDDRIKELVETTRASSWEHPDGGHVVVSRNQHDPNQWRTTRVNAEGEPGIHEVAVDHADALRNVSKQGIDISRTPVKSLKKAEDFQAPNQHDPNPLGQLLSHPNARERLLALKSKGVTPHHLRLALQDPDPLVRAYAAAHPNLSAPLIHEALKHDDPNVKLAAMGRADLSPEHISTALFDPDLREHAAIHPKATDEQKVLVHGLLNKSIGLLEYPQLGQTRRPVPMIRTRAQHKAITPALKLRPKSSASVSYTAKKRSQTPPEKRRMASSVSVSPFLMGNIDHETQHGIFAHLKQIHGQAVAQKIIDQTLNSLSPEHKGHVRNITNWAMKTGYTPAQEPEEQLANLQNYLQDPLWRNKAHADMKILGDPVKERNAHDNAKHVWRRLQQATKSITPESVGIVRKSEAEIIEDWIKLQKTEEVLDSGTIDDQMGFKSRFEAYLKAAKFLAHCEPDTFAFRQAMLNGLDPNQAALVSVCMEPTKENLAGLDAILKLQDGELSKSLLDETHRTVKALMPDGQEIADALSRGLASKETHEDLHLNGKHSKGAMWVKDPESNQQFLIKPG